MSPDTWCASYNQVIATKNGFLDGHSRFALLWKLLNTSNLYNTWILFGFQQFSANFHQAVPLKVLKHPSNYVEGKIYLVLKINRDFFDQFIPEYPRWSRFSPADTDKAYLPIVIEAFLIQVSVTGSYSSIRAPWKLSPNPIAGEVFEHTISPLWVPAGPWEGVSMFITIFQKQLDYKRPGE